MRTMKRLLLIITTLYLLPSEPTSFAKEPRQVSIKYLNAAISSIPNKTEISLEARYGGDLHKTPLWRGYNQFSLVSPNSNETFSFAVCETGDDIFNTLLDAEPGTLFNVEGLKSKLSGKFYDCLIVTDLHPLSESDPSTEIERVRLTITHQDGTREIVRNLAFGETHEVAGIVIQVELDDAKGESIDK